MISVITPSVRKEGLKLVEKALKRQTFKDFEWLIVSPFNPEIKDCIWVMEPEKKPEDYWTVYKAYNKAIKSAKGELIVSWQDFTSADPDCLEKFWYHYSQEPNTLVSAVGNKYTNDTFTVETWRDPRIRSDQGSYYACFFQDCEWNLCAVPRAALSAVGGFDEELDKYSSLCGLDVLARLNMVGGWNFKLDQTIHSYSLEHGRLPMWETFNPFKLGIWERKLIEYQAQPVLKYL